VLPLDTLVARWLANERAPRPSVALTFDDAYLNNLEYAIPVLRKFGCPCTIFVPVGYIDTDTPFWWDLLESWIRNAIHSVVFRGVTYDLATNADKGELFEVLRVSLTQLGPSDRRALLRAVEELLAPKERVPSRTLSWAQIEQLADGELVTFGAHTVGHFAMCALRDEELLTELRDSQQVLARHVANPSRIFAYPYGRYRDLDPRAGAVLRDLGFLGAVTLVAGALEDSPSPYALRRAYIEERDDLLRLRAKIAGVDWPFWFARRLRSGGDRRLPRVNA
jgi:peptidoglycan/xylan/chitin deacetylase (PgdA/CDA1 family)